MQSLWQYGAHGGGCKRVRKKSVVVKSAVLNPDAYFILDLLTCEAGWKASGVTPVHEAKLQHAFTHGCAAL